MLIYYGEAGDKLLESSWISKATLRTTLEPIPVSFECSVRLNDEVGAHFAEGKDILVGKYKTKVRIVFARNVGAPLYTGGTPERGVQRRDIIALHTQSHKVSFVQPKAVFRNKLTLSQVYNACGASTTVVKDFSVERFYCMKGSVPTFLIAELCKEEGGVICHRIEKNYIEFCRYNDLLQQVPKVAIENPTDDTQKSGFIERNEIPAFFSLDESGAFMAGDYSKQRAIYFSPRKNKRQLFAMSHALVNAKDMVSHFNPDINAGDVVEISKRPFIVLTAAHETQMATGAIESRSHFWLGVVA